MKILTTQNLNSLVKDNKSINCVSTPNEIRSNYLQNDFGQNLFERSQSDSMVSFKKKKPTPNEVKRLIESIKKAVGQISEKASPEVKKGDKVYRSPLFNKILKVVDYETVVQASIAAVACALRGGTIMAMSNEENRGNNTYAVSHAFASGLVGLVTVFALTTPFKAGSDHVLKKMFKDLKLDTLKRLHPQLDEKSIVDAAGKRIDDKLWKNLDGKAFCKEVKSCEMLPKFKNLADVSVETFEKILGVNVDWAAQKGKSFNEVLTKDGRKLYDVIDFANLGINVSHIETPTGKKVGLLRRLFNKNATVKPVETKGQILFRDMDRAFLEEYISKADDTSAWKRLDLNTAFKDGKMQDFRLWREKGTGSQWLLDLDTIKVSSPIETFDQAPRITGRLRFDAKEGIHKFRTYQTNGVNGELGTEISDAMLKADKESAGLIKSLTWLPDLVFRIPVALTTVSLIPWMLKTVFHVEKKKPAPAQTNEAQTQQAQNTPKEEKAQAVSFKGLPPVETESDSNVAFKAAPTPKKPGLWKKAMEKVGEVMAKLYGKPLIESERMAKISAKLSDVPGGLTQLMSAFGALLTSSAYVYGTLTNKNLDSDKRRTLGINQTLCWIFPTIGAYLVDGAINSRVKKAEYRYGNLQRGDAALARARGEIKKADEILAGLGDKVKGVRVLASLAVFTIIYRYLTPVLVTPLANKIGDKINAKRAEKRAMEAQKAVA